MKYCNNCGKENQNNANFCEQCGNKLASNMTSSQKNTTFFKSKKNLLIITISSLLLVLAIGFYAFKTISSKNNQEQFTTTYNTAVTEAEDGNFEEAIKNLNKLKNNKSSNINIEDDVKLLNELTKAKELLLNDKFTDFDSEKEKISNLNYTGKFDMAKKNIESDLNTYSEHSTTFQLFDLYLYENKIDMANSLIENLQNSTFKLKEIKEHVKNKVDELTKKLKEKDEQDKKAAEEAKKKAANSTKSDVELGGPNPAKLNDKNSFPADAQGLGGAWDEDYQIDFVGKMINYYESYLFKKYDGVAIGWGGNVGHFFKMKLKDGRTLSFETKFNPYAKVGNRLVMGVELINHTENTTEILYRTDY